MVALVLSVLRGGLFALPGFKAAKEPEFQLFPQKFATERELVRLVQADPVNTVVVKGPVAPVRAKTRW